MQRHQIFSLILMSCFLPQSAHSAESLALLKKISLPHVDGRIDHMSYDPDGKRLFITALGNDSLEIVDITSGQTIRTINGFSEPQGVLYVAETKRLYVSNGGNDNLTVLDSTSFHILHQIKLGMDVDNIRYDFKNKKIYVGSGAALYCIDAKNDTNLGRVNLPDHPEAFDIEESGSRIFVNIPTQHKIFIIDQNSFTITDTWLLDDSCRNFPMALDDTNKQLFIGCRGKNNFTVLNIADGKLIVRLKTHDDSDDIFYDPTSQSIFVSSGEGFISIYRLESRNQITLIAEMTTRRGARTSLLNSEYYFLAMPRIENQDAEIRIYTHKSNF